jgi:hypothetical protein
MFVEVELQLERDVLCVIHELFNEIESEVSEIVKY